jgi:hypothetical protein
MNHAATTTAFLNHVDSKIKNAILTNIANHYGISNEQALEEITHEDAENIMEYITGPFRGGIFVYFSQFERMNLMIEAKTEALCKAHVFVGGLSDNGIDYYYNKLVQEGKIIVTENP